MLRYGQGNSGCTLCIEQRTYLDLFYSIEGLNNKNMEQKYSTFFILLLLIFIRIYSIMNWQSDIHLLMCNTVYILFSVLRMLRDGSKFTNMVKYVVVPAAIWNSFKLQWNTLQNNVVQFLILTVNSKDQSNANNPQVATG